jgi:hypothetical protein
VMLEKNNLDVAAVLGNWVGRLPGRGAAAN